MAGYIDNKNCKLYGSHYCKLLNMRSCAECQFGKLQYDEQADDVRNDLDTLVRLLPEEGISPLFLSEDCVFCKDKPNKRSCFAVMDVCHPEPKRTKRNIIGMKTASKVGSMVTMQLACCSKCRSRYLMLDYIPLIISILFAGGALLALGVRSIYEQVLVMGEGMPILFFAVTVAVGFLLGRLCKLLLTKSFSKHTEFDVWKIPLMAKLKERGWNPMVEEKRNQKLLFTNKRIQRGVCTADSIPSEFYEAKDKNDTQD